jgi:hypothetical protein
MRDTLMTFVGPILLLYAMFKVLLPEIYINDKKKTMKGGYE